VSDQPRKNTTPEIINLIWTELQEVKGRVFDGIPKEIREEIREEIKEVRQDVTRENGITRKLVVGILIAIVMCFAAIIVQDRFAYRSQSVEIKKISDSLEEHREATRNEVSN
jgi:tetrahydromethanopterin S-methyltransferase subunit G